MKKLLGLFLLVCSFAFANWEKIELKDEFGDFIGQIAMIKSVDYFQGFRLVREDNGNVAMDLIMGPQCEVGELYPIKAKVDKGEVIDLTTLAVSDRILRILAEDKFFDKLKKGNNVSFVAYNTNGGSVNLKTDLNGFTKAYNRVKGRKVEIKKDANGKDIIPPGAFMSLVEGEGYIIQN